MRTTTSHTCHLSRFVLAAILFFSQSVFAHSVELNVLASRSRPSGPITSHVVFPSFSQGHRRQPATMSQLLQIPRVLGTLRTESGSPIKFDGRPVLIHVHDVHRHREAQKKIGELLRWMWSKGLVGQVGLEGAFDEISFKPFWNFSRQPALAAVADAFLEQNDISGPVHTLLTAGHSRLMVDADLSQAPRVVGVDDPVLYQSNVKAYREASQSLVNPLAALQVVERQWRLDFESVPSALKNLLALRERIWNGDLSLGSYATSLDQYPSLESFHPMMETYIQAVSLEQSLDIKTVAQQRQILMKRLLDVSNPAASNMLMSWAVQLRASAISTDEFIHQLMALAQNNNVNWSDLAELNRYRQYMDLTSAIDVQQLHTELNAREHQLVSLLAKTESDHAVAQRQRDIYLTKKLIHFSLNRQEWDEYQHQQSSRLVSGLQPFEEFYRVAELRDKSMIDTVLRQPPSKGATVLVAGGFHAQGLKKAAEQSGVQVVSFVPRLSAIDDQAEHHLTSFAQDRAPLDEFFHGQRLFLAHHPFGPGAVGVACHVAGVLGVLGETNPSSQFQELSGHVLSGVAATVAINLSDQSYQGKLLRGGDALPFSGRVQTGPSLQVSDLQFGAPTRDVRLLLSIFWHRFFSAKTVDRWWFRSLVVPAVELVALPGFAMVANFVVSETWAWILGGTVFTLLHGFDPSQYVRTSADDSVWRFVLRHPIKAFSGQNWESFGIRLFVSMALSSFVFDLPLIDDVQVLWPNPVTAWLLQVPWVFVGILHGLWNAVVEQEYGLNLLRRPMAHRFMAHTAPMRKVSKRKALKIISKAASPPSGHSVHESAQLIGSGTMTVSLRTQSISLSWNPQSIPHDSVRSRLESKFQSAFELWRPYLEWRRAQPYQSEHDQVMGLRHVDRQIPFEVFHDPDDVLFISTPGLDHIRIDDEFFKLPTPFRALLLNHETQPNEFYALFEDIRFFQWMMSWPGTRKRIESEFKDDESGLLSQPYFEFLKRLWPLSDLHQIDRLIACFMVEEMIKAALRHMRVGDRESAEQAMEAIVQSLKTLKDHHKIQISVSALGVRLKSLLIDVGSGSYKRRRQKVFDILNEQFLRMPLGSFDSLVINELNVMYTKVKSMVGHEHPLRKIELSGERFSASQNSLSAMTQSPDQFQSQQVWPVGALLPWLMIGERDVRNIGFYEGVLVAMIQGALWALVDQVFSVDFFAGTGLFWFSLGLWSHYYLGIFDPLKGPILNNAARSVGAGIIFSLATAFPLFVSVVEFMSIPAPLTWIAAAALCGVVHAGLNVVFQDLNIKATRRALVRGVLHAEKNISQDDSEATLRRLEALINQTELAKRVDMVGQTVSFGTGDQMGDMIQTLSLLTRESRFRVRVHQALARLVGYIISDDPSLFGGTYDIWWNTLKDQRDPQITYVFLPSDPLLAIRMINQQMVVAAQYRPSMKSVIVFVAQDETERASVEATLQDAGVPNSMLVVRKSTFVDTEQLVLAQTGLDPNKGPLSSQLIFPSEYDLPEKFLSEQDLLRVRLYRLLTTTFNPLMIELRFDAFLRSLQSA